MSEENKNKRKHERVDARVQVQFRTGDEFATCYSKNISKGGIFLESRVLPDPNANIELNLDLSSFSQEAEPKSIQLMGRVVRLVTIVEDSKPLHKVAIQFIDIDAHTQLLLDQVYEKLTTN